MLKENIGVEIGESRGELFVRISTAIVHMTTRRSSYRLELCSTRGFMGCVQDRWHVRGATTLVLFPVQSEPFHIGARTGFCKPLSALQGSHEFINSQSKLK
jgi:hypothetical protein